MIKFTTTGTAGAVASLIEKVKRIEPITAFKRTVTEINYSEIKDFTIEAGFPDPKHKASYSDKTHLEEIELLLEIAELLSDFAAEAVTSPKTNLFITYKVNSSRPLMLTKESITIDELFGSLRAVLDSGLNNGSEDEFDYGIEAVLYVLGSKVIPTLNAHNIELPSHQSDKFSQIILDITNQANLVHSLYESRKRRNQVQSIITP